MAEALAFSFQTAGELKISQVFPADGSQDVPLVSAEEQAKLPAPIRIDPEASGHGEWINTSLYVFHPQTVLKGGARYTVTVPAGLADASGDQGVKLAKDYSWTFQTHPPSVDALQLGDTYNPTPGMPNVVLDPSITIQFGQPMELIPASGVNEDQYLPAAKLGVCKVNIDTDGRLVWCAIHREMFRDKPDNFDLRPPGKVFMAAYADYIVHKNTMLGSSGQLEGVRKTIKE